MNDEALVKLADLLGQSAGETVSQYGVWHFTSAACWIIFGVLLAISTKFIPELKDGQPIPRAVIVAAILFIAALFVFANVPDLFAPKAMGIHQLIKDVRG